MSMEEGLAVVIATKNRSAELANRSLRSVVEQTRLPDHLVVVDDSDRRYRASNRRIVASANLPGVRVAYMQNDRTPGASGAWNVALDHLHRLVEDPTKLFVAILDDDDRWEPSYLENCAVHASAQGLSMVGADLLRIEQLDAEPILNPAPEVLCAADFLIGNPGIQGSNLFVRLDVLLAAGLFDEGLASSTDRDLCTRIADLEDVRYGRLAKPLVEHFAEPERARLTQRGSEPKRRGLGAFWHKWSGRMAPEQKQAFWRRAGEFFGLTEDDVALVESTATTQIHAAAMPSATPVALVVGVIADTARPESLMGLVRDLLRFQEDPRLAGLDVVFLENGHGCGNAGPLRDAALALRDAGAGCYVVPRARQIKDARAGLFGTPFDPGADRVSIAVARTMLQTYAYVIAKPRTGAVVWILDGDCRLDNLVWDGRRVVEQPSDILGALTRLRAAKVDVALGTVSDAPPVPFASCIRTQLVDAYHNLEVMAATDPDAPWPDRQPENMAARAARDDYYYDLSRRDTDHLETPFWFVPTAPAATVRDAFREMVSRLPRMLAGEQVFRPIMIDGRQDPVAQMQPSIHRGGNTFVLDVEALRDFPNAAPRVDGSETRRSDMVWSLLNRYVARRTVVKLPLVVRQDRSDEPVGSLDLSKLARDIQGYALYSALEDVLLGQHEGARLDADEGPSGLDDVEPAQLENRMKKYLRERLAAFSLSFRRAAGLARILEKFLGQGSATAPWWIADPQCKEAVDELRQFVGRLRTEYDLSRLPQFIRDVSAIDVEVIHQFLAQLREDLAARQRDEDAMRDVAQWVESERVISAKHRVRREFGVGPLRLLGCGDEGVVLTDEQTVFKVLDYWKTRMPRRQLEFLRSQVGRWEGVPGLYPIREVRTVGSSVVITYEYESSEPYSGGHGEGLVRLLQGCRAAGIVCNNIHPDNLIVTAAGVKLVDYGADIRAYSDENFEHMARRAFLSFKHTDREDLKAIMRRALTDHALPELDGFELFRKAVEPASKEHLVDLWIASALGDGHGRTVLDYGCGKGKLAERLAGAGWRVTAYDPDPTLTDSWSSRNGKVRFGERALLAQLHKQPVHFDAMVCCLVLCILDEDELREVVADLSRFARPDGHVIVVVCNPDHVHGTTQLQRRHPPEGADANGKFRLEKLVFSTGARITDMHRPVSAYIELFKAHGLELQAVHETPGVDLETFEPTSDFMIFHLRSVVRKEVSNHVGS